MGVSKRASLWWLVKINRKKKINHKINKDVFKYFKNNQIDIILH